jgi:hypothetical protein
MAYGTPTYNYESSRSALTQNKGLEDVARNYGRFMSQERFRRAGEDQTLGFQRNMPKVGSRFNRRGMYNSGLRRQGQQEFANDFQRQQARLQYDQGAEATQADMAQAAADARYQQALLDLFERQQLERAAGYDPLAAVR